MKSKLSYVDDSSNDTPRPTPFGLSLETLFARGIFNLENVPVPFLSLILTS